MSANEFLPWLRRASSRQPKRRRRRADAPHRSSSAATFVQAARHGRSRHRLRPRWCAPARRRRAPARTDAEPWSPHAYVRVADDGIVTIVCHRSEMGQGIRTTMPMIIADEMEADWAKCRVEQAVGDDPKYGSQNTDGSTSIRDFLPKYREAGATTRALLEDAAAKAMERARVPKCSRGSTRSCTGRPIARSRSAHSSRPRAPSPCPRQRRVRIKRPPSGAGRARRCRRSISCR